MRRQTSSSLVALLAAALTLAGAVAALSILATAARADFKDGKRDYDNYDFVAAFDEWEPLARQGDPDAQYWISLLYMRGEGVKQNSNNSCRYLKLAAYSGHLNAMVRLAQYYSRNTYVIGLPFEVNRLTEQKMRCFEASYQQAYLWATLALNRLESRDRLLSAETNTAMFHAKTVRNVAAQHLTPEQRREIMREVEARISNPEWSRP